MLPWQQNMGQNRL